MSNSLEIINSFTAIIDGNTYVGKQGEIADAITEAYGITITGNAHIVPGTLATDGEVTLYDDDDDVPTDWNYFFLWTEQDMHLQILAASMCDIKKIIAKVPFSMSYNGIFITTSTSIISAAPSYLPIDAIALCNYSGSSGKFLAAFFD